MTPSIQTVAYALMTIGQLFVAGKYVFKALIAWREKNKAQAEFMNAMRCHHLPHVYETLRAICFYLNIPYEEPKTYGSN